MSSNAEQDAGSAAPGLDRLAGSVRRLLEEHEALRARLATAEKRTRDLQVSLGDVKAGRVDPAALEQKIKDCERENKALRQRLTLAHDVVRRIQVRLDFTEEEVT